MKHEKKNITAKDLLHAIGEIDDKFVEESAPRRDDHWSSASSHNSTTNFMQRTLAMVACVAVLLVSGVKLSQSGLLGGGNLKTESAQDGTAGGSSGIGDNDEIPPENVQNDTGTDTENNTPQATSAPNKPTTDGTTSDHHTDDSDDASRDEATAALIASNNEILSNFIMPTPQPRETTPDGLPVLSPDVDSGGGMGFEGVILHDFSEYIDRNPGWDCLPYDGTLPVYFTIYGDYPDVYPEQLAHTLKPDIDSMTDRAITIANQFGIDTSDTAHTTITDNAPSPEDIATILSRYAGAPSDTLITGLYADRVKVESTTADIAVTVGVGKSEGIQFTTPRTLKTVYDASVYQDDIAYLTAVGQELIDTYGNYLDMEQPQVEIGNLDYNIYGERNLSVIIYEGAGDAKEQLLHYHFDRVVFYFVEGGIWTLCNIHRQQYDLSDYAGEYPIISKDEATAQLIQGNYITTAPEPVTAESNIAAVQLVYRLGAYERSYMPYYRFYVQLEEIVNDHMEANNLNNYGAYYVPAVKAEYLTENILWDGGFN